MDSKSVMEHKHTVFLQIFASFKNFILISEDIDDDDDNNDNQWWNMKQNWIVNKTVKKQWFQYSFLVEFFQFIHSFISIFFYSITNHCSIIAVLFLQFALIHDLDFFFVVKCLLFLLFFFLFWIFPLFETESMMDRDKLLEKKFAFGWDFFYLFSTFWFFQFFSRLSILLCFTMITDDNKQVKVHFFCLGPL